MMVYTDRSFLECLQNQNTVQIAKDLADAFWLESEETFDLHRRMLLERVP